MTINVTVNNVTPESRVKLIILHKALKRTHANMFDEMIDDYWNKYKDTIVTRFPSKKIDELANVVLDIYVKEGTHRRKNAQGQSDTSNRWHGLTGPEIHRDVPPIPIPKSN